MAKRNIAKHLALAKYFSKLRPEIYRIRPNETPQTGYPATAKPDTKHEQFPNPEPAVINGFTCGFPFEEMITEQVSDKGNVYLAAIRDKALSKVRQGIADGQIKRNYALYSLRMAELYDRNVAARIATFRKRKPAEAMPLALPYPLANTSTMRVLGCPVVKYVRPMRLSNGGKPL